MGQHAHYLQVVPNSHYWTDLDMLIRTLEFDVEYHKPESKKARKKRIKESKIPIIDCYEPLTMEHLLVELKNARDHGYELKLVKKKKRRTMKKKKVYKRVDGELEYQELKWVVRRDANGTPDESKPPSEWVNYMQHHMNEANTAIYNLQDEEALAQIRKVVALGVRALMIHGCPKREIPEELLNED